MLNNVELNRRINKLFKLLKEQWRILAYRIAVESGIPHASLSYMRRGKFEWKLNHLLAIVDFLKRYGVKTSVSDLLDFSGKKTFNQIFDMKDADFREVHKNKKVRGHKPFTKKKSVKKESELDPKLETDTIMYELNEVVKDSRLYKNAKIVIGVKINGKNINFRKEIKF